MIKNLLKSFVWEIYFMQVTNDIFPIDIKRIRI